MTNINISPKSTLLDAIRIIDQVVGEWQLFFKNGELIGTLTDGDIRRCPISWR